MSTQISERIPQWSRGDRLRKARTLTGLSTREFAERVGISPKSVNNYEGDAVEPRKIVMNAWALATGVPVEWLETGIDPHGHNDGPGADVRSTRRYVRGGTPGTVHALPLQQAS